MKVRLVSFLIYWAARLVAQTLRLRVVGEAPLLARERAGQGVILATWHGRTLIPITRFRARRFWAIISTSRDGEYQNQIFGRFGFQTVRGSTSARGAIKSALSMLRHLKEGAILVHAPDGPRGPSRCVHAGAIFLAQKSGCPIIPGGISARPRRLLPTWDHYMLPRPFARAAWFYGEPIFVPANLTEEEQHVWADQLAETINALEAKADRALGLSPSAEAP